jgi:hypothetical protein
VAAQSLDRIYWLDLQSRNRARVLDAGKKRMEMIMEDGVVPRLNWARKPLARGPAMATFATSLAFGLLTAPSALAQAAPQAIQSPEVTAELRAEQALPRTVVQFDPKHFDKYAGYYQLGPTVVDEVHRDGGHFLIRLTGQIDTEVFPESETKFFMTVVHAQISFNSDARGRATEMVIHQNGHERHMPRIDQAAARNIEAALAQRIISNTPFPGTEAALRHVLESEEKGQEDYSQLGPIAAINVKADLPNELRRISSLGPLKSIAFKSVTPGGADVYDVIFERGETLWNITPLADEKIDIGWRRLP